MSANSEKTQGAISKYWVAYGGFRELFRSRYFWFSVVATLFLFPIWSTPLWWDLVLSVIPSLLGFSLGGFAIWLSLGDDDYKKLIAGREEGELVSPYMEVNALFAHFIILQVLAVLLALFSKAYYIYPEDYPALQSVVDFFGDGIKHFVLVWYYFSFMIFVYALVSALAATFALYDGADWFDQQVTKEKAKAKAAKAKAAAENRNN